MRTQEASARMLYGDGATGRWDMLESVKAREFGMSNRMGNCQQVLDMRMSSRESGLSNAATAAG